MRLVHGQGPHGWEQGAPKAVLPLPEREPTLSRPLGAAPYQRCQTPASFLVSYSYSAPGGPRANQNLRAILIPPINITIRLGSTGI